MQGVQFMSLRDKLTHYAFNLIDTRRNTNIALLSNYAVGKSYTNYNQIVFCIALVTHQANTIVILIVIYTYFLQLFV